MINVTGTCGSNRNPAMLTLFTTGQKEQQLKTNVFYITKTGNALISKNFNIQVWKKTAKL